jgi:hypothetical protein
MSLLWARATETRRRFDVNAPQPAEARSLLTNPSTCASALVRPVPLVGGRGAGLAAGAGAGERAGRALVRVGVGFARTAGRVVRVLVPCRLLGARVVEGRLVLVAGEVLVLGAAAGAAAASPSGAGGVEVGTVIVPGSVAFAPRTAAPPDPQPASSTPPATVASSARAALRPRGSARAALRPRGSARAALGARIGVIPLLSW